MAKGKVDIFRAGPDTVFLAPSYLCIYLVLWPPAMIFDKVAIRRRLGIEPGAGQGRAGSARCYSPQRGPRKAKSSEEARAWIGNLAWLGKFSPSPPLPPSYSALHRCTRETR